MNRKIIFLKIFALVITSFTSCDIMEGNTKPKEKQWVYIELSTISKTDTTDYFLYGQINKSIINKINDNEGAKGLFVLSNARFTNDDELLELYEDRQLSGELVFKIQDIEEIKFYNDDPVKLFDINELHESAKKLRNKNYN
ncbi:hypothetical protein JBL43_01635 [Aureibaculum sp. A20]|uniref:Lipoprotein n=1 Tax=Aureibaculum flavum TaxID=2795986 RepID=A0ABS0WLU4_9FLAO|nr:hypothetical protein [Aureibaculum flavum]MBJ2172919.1 hypothetical protein [Aureibaculum flavum]